MFQYIRHTSTLLEYSHHTAVVLGLVVYSYIIYRLLRRKLGFYKGWLWILISGLMLLVSPHYVAVRLGMVGFWNYASVLVGLFGIALAVIMFVRKRRHAAAIRRQLVQNAQPATI